MMRENFPFKILFGALVLSAVWLPCNVVAQQDDSGPIIGLSCGDIEAARWFNDAIIEDIPQDKMLKVNAKGEEMLRALKDDLKSETIAEVDCQIYDRTSDSYVRKSEISPSVLEDLRNLILSARYEYGAILNPYQDNPVYERRVSLTFMRKGGEAVQLELFPEYMALRYSEGLLCRGSSQEIQYEFYYSASGYQEVKAEIKQICPIWRKKGKKQPAP